MQAYRKRIVQRRDTIEKIDGTDWHKSLEPNHYHYQSIHCKSLASRQIQCKRCYAMKWIFTKKMQNYFAFRNAIVKFGKDHYRNICADIKPRLNKIDTQPMD
jgi:hypothetical protein